MREVTYAEVEASAPRIVAVSSTPIILSSDRIGDTRRTSLTITPTTAGVTVTVTMGEVEQCAANVGDPLSAGQVWGVTDSLGSPCWQGTVCVVASGPGSISVSETFESGQR